MSQAFVCIALSCMAGGCQTARVAHPLTANLAGNDPDAQLEFWHTLATRHVTSNDEAFHGLLLYLDSRDAANTYADRVALLKNRKMLPGDFSEPPEQSISRGNLAVAIVRALQIKGGLALHLFGVTPRYATKELVYLDVYPASSPNQTFSGAEFVGIIGKMEDYQTANGSIGATAGSSGPSAAPAPQEPAAGPKT